VSVNPNDFVVDYIQQKKDQNFNRNQHSRQKKRKRRLIAVQKKKKNCEKCKSVVAAQLK
jgi:hypothetical protein